MRLTQAQIEVICASAVKNFGQSAHLWLFGSRVDEQSKGGDIDLYIEPEIQDPAELIDAKLHFLLELHKKLGQQKIDVVLRRAEFKEDLLIFRIAKETGVQLL
ncbi:MAG: nucleotidyltransferase domain-containing protein [Methylococcaceae bacterium]